MTTEFILPDIGEGIVECELLEWLVAEGDIIEEDQPVAEVMTDKATVQIPAMHAGKVLTLHYQVGDIAKVHAPLFAMQINDEQATPASDEGKPAQHNTAEIPNLPEADEPNTTSAAEQGDLSAPNKTGSGTTEDFILPDIGEGIVECEIVKWHVAKGDTITEDQPVVEVMTDKAVVEIPAKHAGIVSELYYQQGDIAKVHAPLFCLTIADSAATPKAPADTAGPAPSARSTTQATPSASPAAADTHWPDGEFEPPVAIPGRVLASPAVRRIAREQQIDLTQLTGSGKKGRILKQDVVNYQPPAAQRSAGDTDAAGGPARSTASSSDSAVSSAGGYRVEAVRGVRAAMAKQMAASVQTIPHFTVSDELRMDALIALREQLKPAFAEQGVKLSFMPFFVKALSLALNAFPILNSQLNDDVTELRYFDDHNIGFAVDSKIGLLVPNIKQVQTLSLFDIASQMQDIIEQARAGKIAGDTLKGGTISISNIGALGGITATPVINKPEAAIVALGKTQRLPRFNANDEVEAHHIMQVNWSGDHRIVDGATMVKFNNLWCHYLMNPTAMLAHLR